MKRFEKLTLQNKILFTSSASLFLGALITAWSLLTINRIEKTISFVSIAEQEARDVLEASNVTARLVLADLSYLLTEDALFAFERTLERERLDTYIIEAEAIIEFDTLLPEESQQVQQDLTLLKEQYAAYEGLYVQGAEATRNDDLATAQVIGAELEKNALEMFEATEEIHQIFSSYADNEIAIARRQIIITSIVGLVAVVAFIIVTVASRRLTRQQLDAPIQTLLDISEAIEAGDYDTTALVDLTSRTDEIGFLARSFQRMAEEVSQRESQLKDKIAADRQTLKNLEA